jgi:hypothetical protein
MCLYGENMNRVSSSYLFISKKVLPAIWFGFIGVALTLVLYFQPEQILLAVVQLLIVAGITFSCFKVFVFDLADEVYDTGNSLIIRFGQKAETISYDQIKSITYFPSEWVSRAIISVKGDCSLGKEIPFCPRWSCFDVFKNKVVQDLNERIENRQERG